MMRKVLPMEKFVIALILRHGHLAIVLTVPRVGHRAQQLINAALHTQMITKVERCQECGTTGGVHESVGIVGTRVHVGHLFVLP